MKCLNECTQLKLCITHFALWLFIFIDKTRSNRFLRQRQWSRGESNVHAPNALNVFLTCFHVDINRPEVPSLGMRINNAFEDRLSAFRFAKLVLQQSESGYRLKVWYNVSFPFVCIGDTNVFAFQDLTGCEATTSVPLRLNPFGGSVQ